MSDPLACLQDDAHIFCLPEQIESEILGVLDMVETVLSQFGFKDFEARRSPYAPELPRLECLSTCSSMRLHVMSRGSRPACLFLLASQPSVALMCRVSHAACDHPCAGEPVHAA